MNINDATTVVADCNRIFMKQTVASHRALIPEMRSTTDNRDNVSTAIKGLRRIMNDLQPVGFPQSPSEIGCSIRGTKRTKNRTQRLQRETEVLIEYHCLLRKLEMVFELSFLPRATAKSIS